MYPYDEWVKNSKVNIKSIDFNTNKTLPEDSVLLDLQQAFGYNKEDLKFFLEPMILDGQDPIGSMGRDIPLAALSDKNRLLYDYFFQNFAQVTNPPIDPIREELVMSLMNFIGPRPNLLDPKSGKNQKLIEVDHPILDNLDIEKIRNIDKFTSNKLRSVTLSICYNKKENPCLVIENFLQSICIEAERVINSNACNIIILSDREVDQNKIAIPALLATSSVHHHLIRKGLRTKVGLIIETGEARRVHDLCLLAG